MAAKTLYLPLKAEYFHAIKAGEKLEEYRLANAFWKKRLEGREFDRIELTLGYPAAGDMKKRLLKKWNGYTIKDILHPHFGDELVTVFAIDVSQPWTER